jgi:hypothetical protein
MKGQSAQPNGAMIHVEVLLNLLPTHETMLTNEVQSKGEYQGNLAAKHQPSASDGESKIPFQQCIP